MWWFTSPHFLLTTVTESQIGTWTKAECCRSEADTAGENVTPSSSWTLSPRRVLISDRMWYDKVWMTPGVRRTRSYTVTVSHLIGLVAVLLTLLLVLLLREARLIAGCSETGKHEMTKECLWYSFTQIQTHTGSHTNNDPSALAHMYTRSVRSKIHTIVSYSFAKLLHTSCLHMDSHEQNILAHTHAHSTLWSLYLQRTDMTHGIRIPHTLYC